MWGSMIIFELKAKELRMTTFPLAPFASGRRDPSPLLKSLIIPLPPPPLQLDPVKKLEVEKNNSKFSVLLILITIINSHVKQ